MRDAPPTPAAADARDRTDAGPLGPIALSLSGGGYRAAAFHLGVLAFLERMQLLDDVTGLSTVSGGSITGMAWVLSRIDGEPFPAFHRRLAAWMRETHVVDEALLELTANRAERRRAWPSLIRSAAEVYARPALFGDRRFETLLDAEGLGMEEVIFNATEFHSGIAFRFRASGNPYARIGNRNYTVPRNVARHVRLADIVAASSCFPGGFEPIVFPHHFRWPAEFPSVRAREELGPRYESGLPLMDGGIFDNQGVDSLELAFRRTDATTFLVSDVSVQREPVYNIPPPPLGRGWVTLAMVYRTGWALFWVALAAAVVLVLNGWWKAVEGAWRLEDYFLYLVPGALSAAVAGALVYLRRRLRDAEALASNHLHADAWPTLRRLTVPEAVEMTVLRAGSVLALTSSIFMRRIRSLVFRSVWRNPALDGRRIATLIHTLTEPQPKLFVEHPWLRPAPHLTELSLLAQRVPTTLWFDDPATADHLERAGEASLCLALLLHLLRDPSRAHEVDGTPRNALYLRLRREWDALNSPTPAPPAPASSPA